MACGCKPVNQGCGCGGCGGGCQKPNPCKKAIHEIKHNAYKIAEELEELEGYVNALKRALAEAEEHCEYLDDDDDDDCGCRPQPCRPCGCKPCGCGRPQPRCGR